MVETMIEALDAAVKHGMRETGAEFSRRSGYSFVTYNMLVEACPDGSLSVSFKLTKMGPLTALQMADPGFPLPAVLIGT